MSSLPINELIFWFINLGFAWHGVPLVFIILLFLLFLEPNYLHKASNHPVISKLKHNFYLQHPPSHKHFDPWDVECFSVFGGELGTGFFSHYLLGETATLLALVTTNHCSDLTMY